MSLGGSEIPQQQLLLSHLGDTGRDIVSPAQTLLLPHLPSPLRWAALRIMSGLSGDITLSGYDITAPLSPKGSCETPPP